MSEENKAVARRFYQEVAGQGNLDVADELVAEDFIDHNPRGPITAPGREHLKQVFTGARVAFPDLSMEIQDQYTDGDKVISRALFKGTMLGEYMGMPPTGKSFSIEMIEIFRIEDGMIVERWGQGDLVGMMQQLGMMPSPGG